MRDTRAATDTLKGLAILVVIVNHYLKVHVTDTVGGIAYSFLAVFFLVSGYGIYYSLTRRDISAGEPGKLLRFWADRVLRLLPLYYLAILVRDFVLGGFGSPLHYLNIYGPGHFWFVPAIINCYLVAPFIYMFMRWNRAVAIIGLAVVVLVGTGVFMGGLVHGGVAQLLDTLQLTYKRVFGLHIFLFALGMLAASERRRLERPKGKVAGTGVRLGYLALFVSFPVGYWLVKNNAHGLFAMILQLGMMGLAVAFVGVGLRYAVSFSLLAKIGAVSYGLYLFHMTYFNLMDKAGLLHGFTGVIWATALFPVLVVACWLLETGAGKLAATLRAG